MLYIGDLSMTLLIIFNFISNIIAITYSKYILWLSERYFHLYQLLFIKCIKCSHIAI